jgi:hypothetical protein
MKLLLALALFALLAVTLTSAGPRVRVPDDDLGLGQADLEDDASTTALFARWQRKHGKESLAKDKTKYNKALNNFRAAAKRVKQNHDAVLAGNADHALALNKFSHLSAEEFKGARLGRLPNPRHSLPAAEVPKVKRAAAPVSVNWTAQGYVTPVKDQGDCGCCWTFSTVGALEGAYYKAKKTLQSFSEQELVECVTGYTGCDGGIEDYAFDYMMASKGMDTLASYPYIAGNLTYSPTCQSKPASRVAMNVAWSYLTGTDAAVLSAIQTVGPMAVSIAVNDTFMDYSSGVMDPSIFCLQGDNNHAVLLTGAGTDPVTNVPYWLVKNSWSTDWGENGYFRMSRVTANACGITAWPYVVTVS